LVTSNELWVLLTAVAMLKAPFRVVFWAFIITILKVDGSEEEVVQLMKFVWLKTQYSELDGETKSKA